MSSPGSSPDHGIGDAHLRINPLDNHIPRQSQLARFQQEHLQDGNTLVPLSHNPRDLKSAIDHHKSRATRAIKTFQQSFAKHKPDDATESSTDKPSSTEIVAHAFDVEEARNSFRKSQEGRELQVYSAPRHQCQDLYSHEDTREGLTREELRLWAVLVSNRS
ncbi:uncharacterized protein BDZ83DRAFT_649821 [Colletotrichum acutatum]|uniref:Uncharacterized protein n=1 Tax=Glomerella acutata TaxID=27357 RepID=A0AAD8XJ51_GLOAC|nr:uncharacterized protein BDZ83DRAFT_649821 [Colletotrichum acutatum]KAK1727243.1 hypothetical protein BDZ83DRAFT_649821 [Colletotrichum acutatum]